MNLPTGQYSGFYKYNNQRIQQMLLRDQTFFDVIITDVDGTRFYGTVKEESTGQPGTGTITGELNENKITFVKQMSVAASIKSNGQSRTYNTRHPKIYYEGLFSDNRFKGTWKIKFGFIFPGILPVPVIPTSGTWEMKINN